MPITTPGGDAWGERQYEWRCRHPRPCPVVVQCKPDRTLRFVAFVNEEKPYAHTEQMGSRVYSGGAGSGARTSWE